MMFNNIKIVAVFYLALSFVFCAPVFFNMDNWAGQYDWDDLFYPAVERKTLLEYRQIPLWNPYVGGGNLMLAHPHSSFLSPFFIPMLIFGELVGMKINIFLFLFLGMLGMYLLSKELGIPGIAGILPGIIFMCSSWYPLEMFMGHIFRVNMAWVPWVLLFYLKSLKERKYIIFASVCVSFIVAAGEVNVLRFLVLILPLYGILKSLQTKKLNPVYQISLLFIIAFLLAAFKTFPMSEFISNNRRIMTEGSGASLSLIKETLLNKNYFYIRENLLGEWLERSGYVGLVPVMLSIAGISYRIKKDWPLIATGAFVLALLMANKFPVNIWGFIHQLFPFNSIHIAGRFILIFVFILSLFSGFGLYFLETKLLKLKMTKRIIITGLCLFVILDLYHANSYIFRKIFTVRPPDIMRDQEFSQYKNAASFILEGNCLYPLFLKNNGAVEGFENVHLKKGGIRAKSYDDNSMRYWAAMEFIHKNRPQAKFIDFDGVNFKDSTTGENRAYGAWRVERPVPGFDSKTYQFHFEEGPLGPNEPEFWHLGYVLFYVYSPRAREGIINAGGSTGMSLWVNKEKIYERFDIEAKRTGAKISVSLKEGWNSFLFCIYQLALEYRNWGIGINKIIDSEGKTYTDLVYDVFKGDGTVREGKDPYRGEVYFLNNSGQAEIKYFSPNKLIIEASAFNPDLLLVNQNYHYGWRAIDKSDDKSVKQRVVSRDGLLGIRLPEGKHTIIFYFLPRLFIIGVCVSIFSLFFSALYLIKVKNQSGLKA